MITFLNIEIRNFMSIGNEWLHFDYKTGLSYVYGENYDVTEEENLSVISNGSGKTVVLVDAPLFALYGRTQRRIKKAEAINIQNGCDCEVRLSFKKDDDVYIIERGMKPDKIIIIKNGVAESEEAKKRQANKVIEEEILDGISFEVFKNLIVLNGTSSKHFFEYGKNEKRTFINEVFRLGFLDYLQVQLTESVKSKRLELDKFEIQKVAKEEEIERLKSLVEAAESGEVVDTSGDLNHKILQEETKIEAAQTILNGIESEVFGGTKEEHTRKHEFAVAKINETNEEIIRLDASIDSLRKEYQRLKTDYEYISTQSNCPQCTQPISQELRTGLNKRLADEGLDVQVSATKVKEEKATLEDKIQKMRDWMNLANASMNTYQTNANIVTHSTSLLTEYKNQLNAKPEGGVSIEAINEEIKTLDQNFQDFNVELEEVKRDYQIHKVCRDLVGGKNFYGFYISIFRNYLNKAINEYLEKMVSPHRIKFNNDLEADVYDGNLKAHSYDNLSTGEKAKINLALLLSFFDVLHAFHRMETSLLVLDEILDSGLDSPSIVLLHEILKEKAKANPHLGIYVVSHKDSKGVWSAQEECSKVVFCKKMGFTTVKEDE